MRNSGGKTVDLERAMVELTKKYTAFFKPSYYIQTSDGAAFGLCEHELRWSASEIKLPIYLYYMEQIVRGNIDPTLKIHIPVEHVRITGSGVVHLLKEKSVFTIQELLQYMIAVSDNEATNQLIRYVGLNTLKAWAKKKHWGNEVLLERYLMDYEANVANELSVYGGVSVLSEIITLGKQYPAYKEQIERPFLKQQLRSYLPGALDEREIKHLTMLNKTGEDPDVRHDIALFRYQAKEIYVATFTNQLIEEAKAIEWMQEVGKLVFHASSGMCIKKGNVSKDELLAE